jgi:ribosomal protein L15
VFNQYYKRTVAQRLLSETSATEHYERAFVSSVKLQCGAVHMREVEQMLQDAQMSADLQAAFDRQGCSEAFQQQLQRLPALTRGGGQGSAAPALSFRILSERVWPPSWRKDEMLHKPRELTVCLEEIADFYSQRRLGGSGSGSGSGSGAGSGSGSGSGSASASSVRLDWVSAKGRGELYPCYGRFGGKKGTRPLKLDVSVYQAAILLLFNAPGVRTLTLTEIAAQLGMDVENARRYVASLCLGKHKALRKGEGMAPPSAQEGGGGAHRSKSSSKVVGDHDPLRVNEKLASDIVDRRTRKPKSRVSFPVPKRESAKAKAKEDQLAGQAVQEERKYAIEAAVVRTMKMQRTIKMQLLVAEVVAQLSYLFVPDPRYIKRRVADLIDREFLARDDDDPMQLHYVA